MKSQTVGPAVVLVVDDEETCAQVAESLRGGGLEVIATQRGQAALKIARTGTIGLVVLSMSLPGVSGAELVRTLRARSETARLPILLITGPGDEAGGMEGLDAGADDFVAKPIRPDQLVARVNAHLRRQAAWSHVVEDELRIRASVVAALSHLNISSDPVEAAEAVVRELTKTDSDFVAVLQVGAGGQLQELATYDRSAGVQRGGRPLTPGLARHVLARARHGPWVEEVKALESGEQTSAFWAAPELAAGAPIYAGDDLVGILTIGIVNNAVKSPLVRRAKLLAAAIDYANVLSTRAGAAFADRRDIATTRARLQDVLAARQFRPYFQPIVQLASSAVVGFEALTRFDDGTRPEVRFEEAVEVGLGPDFELASIRAALDGGVRLPGDAFLSINVSPGFVLEGDRTFRRLVKGSTRPLVLELTEHVPIDDYPRVRDALAMLGDVGLAVDDAGAGYASLRHILELRPTYAKLDISLVRGIDEDDLRQALAAGLQYFAQKVGCRLIAEGVETRKEANVLRRLGIEYAQGYLFGQPDLVN
ncbi:MAG: EAL domain-containing response regulator [Chloroflexota bacterium]|nr:EAL domain-containing response regulator [Chloroflexota bacterium]